MANGECESGESGRVAITDGGLPVREAPGLHRGSAGRAKRSGQRKSVDSVDRCWGPAQGHGSGCESAMKHARSGHAGSKMLRGSGLVACSMSDRPRNAGSEGNETGQHGHRRIRGAKDTPCSMLWLPTLRMPDSDSGCWPSQNSLTLSHSSDGGEYDRLASEPDPPPGW